MAAKRSSIIRLTTTALLTGIIVLMAFTPVGYIKTAGLEITLLTVPVVVGAIAQGPAVGAFLGFVFGLTSFIQAATGLSAFGQTMFQLSPLACVVICIPTRMLIGVGAGFIYKAFRHKNAAVPVASFAGPLINTLLFMSALILFFWKSDFIQGFAKTLGTTSVIKFVIAFVGVNGLVEFIACGFISMAVCFALKQAKLIDNDFRRRSADNGPETSG